MSDEKRITIERVGGDFGFWVRWAASDSWADFTVVEVVSFNEEGPFFRQKDGGEDLTRQPEEAEVYCSGYIQWDGCSHVEQHEDHLCGACSFKKHIALLKYLYLRASEVMGRGPDGLDEPWNELDE